MGRRYRAAKRAMRPNRIAARFISGGRHQTFTSIARSPFRTKTITNKGSRRQQYQAQQRRKRAAATKEKRAQQRAAAAARKKAAAATKAAPKPPRKRTPPVPIAVNPRTGKAITLTEAMRSLKEATERAERLAAGQPGDPPATKPRAPRAAAKKAPAKKTVPAPRKKVAAKKNASPPPPPPPPPGPGKNLRGLYLAMTCACQGTGRIYTMRDGSVSGSISCPEHGRRARGGHRVFSRRAMTDSGLSGVTGWLDAKYRSGRGNLDRKQQRAVRQTGRERYAGPVVACEACDEGVVNRALTEQLRREYIGRTAADREYAGLRPYGERRLAAMARKAYPYDRCRVCGGLSVVPDEHAGPWFAHTRLRAQHQPTARERATGHRTAGTRT